MSITLPYFSGIPFNQLQFCKRSLIAREGEKKKLYKFPSGKTIDYFPDKISTGEQLESIAYGLGTRFLDPSLHSK